MKLLELHRLDEEEARGLQPSFNNLTETDHLDGKFRLRRYSIVKVWDRTGETPLPLQIDRMSHRNFTQSEEINEHQGGMVRSFEEIDDVTLNKLAEALTTFKRAIGLRDGQEIEIHQMRVVTSKHTDDTGLTCPEGHHQDGFENIAVLGVDRFNISGGNFHIMESKNLDPILDKVLENGEMMIVKDSELWHYATPIISILPEYQGRMDAFVFCSNKLEDEEVRAERLSLT